MLDIHLLGSDPRVLLAGSRQPPPRGRKAWALLAYLLLSDRPRPREWLAELLFSDAADPLNALSWNLSELRRLLGPDATLGGQPVALSLPPGTSVDLHAVTTATWVQAVAVPDLGEELLAGRAFRSSPGFEAWLLATRRRLAGASEGVLREAARTRLSAGDTVRATDLATRLVTANPLDEDAQELLIRAYAAAGDLAAAAQQRDACVALFRAELGTDPGDGVRLAAEAPGQLRAFPDRPASRAATEARLEAGLTALDAGAVDVAVDLLRQAAAEAHELGEDLFRVRTLVALGHALVHGLRGRDGEGAGVLHEAIAVAGQGGIPASAAQAHRELGYVELLRGRYDRAQLWLGTAASLAGEDDTERAWALAVQGVALTDVGRYDEALHALSTARQLSPEDPLQAWTSTFSGRAHLLRRDLGPARDELVRGLASARSQRWTAFVPLPETLLADVDLLQGHLDEAEAAYEHSHAMALQLDDACWEGLAGRGLGMVAARRGDHAAARELITRARYRCVRVPDAYLWVEAYCLDALCALGLEHWPDEAGPWIDDLELLATRTGMRELVARAYAHRAGLGDGSARDAARVLAADVDNPSLRS